MQGHPSAPMAALESLVSDTVFPECLKVGLNLACSNSLAFDIDKPRLITECLIRNYLRSSKRLLLEKARKSH